MGEGGGRGRDPACGTYQPSLAEVRYRRSVHVVRAGMGSPAVGSAVDFTVTLFASSSGGRCL